MKITREELLSKLKKCLPGVDKEIGLLQGSDTFVFKNDTVLSYNDYISVTIPFPSDLSCAVPATAFYKAVNSFRAKEVEITKDESKLTLKCGRAAVEFPLMDERIYERFIRILPADAIWNDLPDHFVELIKMGIIKNNTATEGIFVHGKHLLGTNQVTIVDIGLDRTLDRFWIKNKVALELIKLGTLEKYCMNASWIHFKSGDLTFSCRKLMDENYPEEQLFKVLDAHDISGATSNGTLPPDLLDALKRASIFSNEDIAENAKIVHCSLVDKELTIASARSTGSFKETLDIERGGDDNVVWSLDVEQFISALQRGGDSVKFYIVKKGTGGAIVLVGDGWRQAIGLIKEE